MTHIDSPEISGTMAPEEFRWTVTPDQLQAKANDAKSSSSPPPLDPPEPSGYDLSDHYYKAGNPTFTGSLAAVYRLGREHGRQEVAKRLPRLWGKWPCSGWGKLFSSNEGTISMYYNYDKCHIHELDPMTGVPKK